MTSEAATSPANRAGKYLTVSLMGESYAIAVLKVREIMRLPTITPVPQLPAHVKGVINLRGRMVPIIDLRAKFGFPAENTARTCVVVVQIQTRSQVPAALGVIVDTVEEVIALHASEIEPTPEFGASIDTQYLLGLAKSKGQVKILLDIERVAGLAEV